MRRSHIPGIIGNAGCERASACTWLFSSTLSTTAASGGFRYSPTMSYTFSTNSGSVDSLNVSVRCGCNPNACQIRPIVDRDRPERSAILRLDQCVAFSGVDSSVSTTTRSTCSTLIVRGRPGLGSSHNPSNRNSQNRRRHFPTVGGDTPHTAAASLFERPSAHASTIRERNASACEDVRRRSHLTNCSRSCGVSVNSVFGRPVLAIRQDTTFM